MRVLPRPRRRPRILVVDVGGSHVKLLATDQTTSIKIPTGPDCTAEQMVAAVCAAVQEIGWRYDVVSLGYPGPVVDGKIAVEPRNLGPGWVDYDFEAAFERPVRLINDAAMQALGGYTGGRMLFLGLGTGLGNALVIEGHLQPLELAHLPYEKKRSFEDVIGEPGRKRIGTARWRRHVFKIVGMLVEAMQVRQLLLGGGNARRLVKWTHRLPPGTRLGSNDDAFRGGFRLWLEPEDRALTETPVDVAHAAAEPATTE